VALNTKIQIQFNSFEKIGQSSKYNVPYLMWTKNDWFLILPKQDQILSNRVVKSNDFYLFLNLYLSIKQEYSLILGGIFIFHL
jgi:hypothetical protein